MRVFTGFCLGLAGLAAVCMVFFLQNMPTERKLDVNLSKTIKSLVWHILFSRKQKLLFFTTIFRGMSPAFVIGDFTIVSIHNNILVVYMTSSQNWLRCYPLLSLLDGRL